MKKLLFVFMLLVSMKSNAQEDIFKFPKPQSGTLIRYYVIMVQGENGIDSSLEVLKNNRIIFHKTGFKDKVLRKNEAILKLQQFEKTSHKY